MLPNLSNAALSGILWVTGLFTKRDLCNMLGIPVFNVGRWPLESFSSTLSAGLYGLFAASRLRKDRCEIERIKK